MDRLTKEQRSYNMSQVRSKNTLPEKLVSRGLRKEKVKFRKHYKLPGKPDILLTTEKIASFIDGEFWHGRKFNQWKHKLSKFWLEKIGGNIKRDKRNRKELKERGWEVIRLWDKEIIKNPEKETNKILRVLRH